MLILRSIRLRLTVWYVLVLAVILAGFSAGIYLTLRYNLNQNLDDSLENRRDVFLEVVEYEGGRPTLEEVPASVDEDEIERYVRLYDTAGQVTLDSSAEFATLEPKDDAVRRALGGESSTVRVKIEDEDDRLRALVVPLERDGGIAGVLEVGITEDDIDDTLSNLLFILIIAYPTTLALASLGGIFLAGRALSPIDRITRVAGRISAKDLSQRLDLEGPQDEVGRLASTFNEMIARLDGAFRRQRQFTADASHELRTPLTAIKGQIEVALTRQRSVDAYREVLHGVNEEVDRLSRLVGSLLTLARADAGEIPIALESVALGDLVRDAVHQVQPAAEEKSVELTIEPGPDATLRADQDLLLQLVLNLLDNAVKYTERGGRIVAAWGVGDGTAGLTVRDNGIGIAAEHVGRIFDRFYRVDKARSRAEGGVGLGLSISRWIVEVHGGELEIESAPGEGTTVTVKLPRDGTGAS